MGDCESDDEEEDEHAQKSYYYSKSAATKSRIQQVANADPQLFAFRLKSEGLPLLYVKTLLNTWSFENY